MSAIQPTLIPSPGAARITSAAIPTAEARMRDRSKVRARAGVRRLVLVVVAALVLAACYPPADADDPYVAAVYEAGELTEHLGLVHGGSFCAGNRTSLTNEAIAYAQRGYVATTIDYRTGPCQGNLLANALDAGSDGQLAIQWLRSQSDAYGIDVDRIAMFGTSAGGAIALMAALDVDLTAGRHDGPESFNPTVSLSTGASLTIGIDAGLVPATAPVSPILMEHHETDTESGETVEEAMATCLLWYDDGVKCHGVISEGSGHTVPIRPTAPNFTSDFAPFLAAELDLANAAAP